MAAVGDQPWNPIEWDRAAEELTWERLLGLDGSLVFLASTEASLIFINKLTYSLLYLL